MAKVWVIGAGGILGRHVAKQAESAGHEVTKTSRRPRYGWTVLDVTKPLPPIDATCIIHCAADPFGKGAAVEADGLRRLREAAPQARILYPSIVGIDRIPQFKYYRIKSAAEQALAEAGGDHAIVRFTQFHEFADRFAAMPIVVYPRHFRFQSLAAAEAAAELVRLIDSDAQGLQGDFGGPEVHALRDMIRDRHRADGKRKLVVGVPMGGFSRGLKAGLNLCPDSTQGSMTWQAHVESTA